MNKDIKIEYIEILNFQSHANTNLDFDEGVNVIIGPSDSGKTAVIRALKWIFFNEPSGTDIIKKGEDSAKVTLKLNTGFKIIRGRSKSKNYYEIISPENETQRFEGFGVNVPQEIINLTGINKIDLGNMKKSLNIAEQLESPFLITDSPSIKANALGKLAGVDIIDKALGNLSKDIYEINSARKSIEKEIRDQKDILKNFEYLKNDKIKIERLEYLFNQVDEYKTKLNTLNDLEKKYSNNLEKTNQTIEYLEKFKNLDELFLIYEKMAYKVNNLKLYSNLNNKLLYTDSKIKELEILLNKIDTDKISNIYSNILEINKNLEKYKSAYKNLVNINKQINQLEKSLKKYPDILYVDKLLVELSTLNINKEKLSKLKNSLDNVNQKLEEGNNYVEKLISNYKTAVNTYIELLKESGTCPICYNKIDDEHIERILEELEV
ncbi:AAA family ATPase [Lagierella massiliensis]|uniref:AAA family ATPase n=1 Tax=Lagierella massiliensis TaxID=1689303 RepID=UPI0006D7FF61|nr:AAA family ATPase [Lagierella massiliensis]